MCLNLQLGKCLLFFFFFGLMTIYVHCNLLQSKYSTPSMTLIHFPIMTLTHPPIILD